MEGIHDRVARLLVERFGLEDADLGPDTTLSDLDIDSLALLEVSLALESEFDVDLDEGEINREHTLAEVGKVLQAKGVRSASA